MNFVDKLNENSKTIIENYTNQPFLKELSEGTLSEDKFRFYMVQDYLYLLEYAKIFAFGIIKSHDEKIMRMFANMVQGTLDTEMKTHKSYMKRIGITNEEIKESKIAFANQSYTSYMLDVANKGDSLDILVAVLSCSLTYAIIGKKISEVDGILKHSLFGDWVLSYASKEYMESVESMIDLINDLAINISKEREEYLINVYNNCCIYERDFWDMAYEMKLY